MRRESIRVAKCLGPHLNRLGNLLELKPAQEASKGILGDVELRKVVVAVPPVADAGDCGRQSQKANVLGTTMRGGPNAVGLAKVSIGPKGAAADGDDGSNREDKKLALGFHGDVRLSAQRSAHRWRPAADARIGKLPRRAAIRCSAKLDSGRPAFEGIALGFLHVFSRLVCGAAKGE